MYRDENMSNKSNSLSRITIEIGKDHHEMLKSLAALQGKNMRDILADLIEARFQLSQKRINSIENTELNRVIEKVLKKYAPALEKLAKS